MNGPLVDTVRRARQLLRLDYREVALSLQVHQSTLYRWRTGETSVSDRGRQRSASLGHFLDEVEGAFPDRGSRMEWLDSALPGFSGHTPRHFLHSGRPDLLTGYLIRAHEARDEATGPERHPTGPGAGFEEAPVPLCVLDRELRVVEMNRRMAEALGSRGENEIGTPFRALVPGAADRIEPLLREVLESGEPSSDLEVSGGRSAGDLPEGVWRVEARPVRGPRGRVVAASVAFEDASGAALARQRLRRNLGSLRAAIRAAPYPVTLVTGDGEVVEISRTLVRVTGHPRRELGTLDRWLDRLFGPDRERAEEWVDAALSGTADPAGVEWPVRTRSGEPRIWEFTHVRLDPLPDGRPLALLTALDVTERKRGMDRMRLLADAGAILTEVRDAEKILRELTKRMVRTVADVGIAYLRAGDGRTGDGRLRRIAYAHRDPERLELLEALARHPPLGEDHALVNRLFDTGDPMLLRSVPEEELATSAEQAGLIADLDLATGIVVPMTGREEPLGAFAVFTSRGGRPPFDEEDRTTVAEIARRTGVTIDNERLHREERRAREEAEVASVAKSQFLSVVSHELRTPLNGILGNASIMEEEIPGELSRGQREHVRRIRAAAGHLAALIDEILTFSTAEAGKEEVRETVIDVRVLVREVVELLEPRAAAKDLILEASVPDERVDVRTDAGKVRQILLNLVGNAVKFTDRGEVEARVVSNGDGVEIEVRDTGPGVPDDARERIFEPFVQIDQSRTRRKGGTGLGLAVASRQAQLLGADIEVHEAAGGGSIFRLRLPHGPDVRRGSDGGGEVRERRRTGDA